jgi:uncharacterized protein (DUF1697 family)
MPIAVFVRTAAKMAEVLRENPFPSVQVRHTYAVFLADVPPPDAVARARRLVDETIHVARLAQMSA